MAFNLKTGIQCKYTAKHILKLKKTDYENSIIINWLFVIINWFVDFNSILYKSD